VVQYPSLRESAVRRVELVRVGGDRALVVVVSADARVEQHTIALGEHVADEDFEAIAREVNEKSVGLTPAALEASLADWRAVPGQADWVTRLADAVATAARGGTVERVVFAGTSHLTGNFEPDTIGALLDALEEQVVLLRFLHEMTAGSADVSVRIGAETHHEPLLRAAIVASPYGVGAQSLVGALGPTRMDYPGTMSAVRAVARYLSRVVEA